MASALPDALIASSLQLFTPPPHFAVAAATSASQVESAEHSIASVQQFCFWHVMHAVSEDAAAQTEVPAVPLGPELLVSVAEPLGADVAVEPVHAESHCESAHVFSALNAALSFRHVSQVPFCAHVAAHVEHAASFLQALASEQHFWNAHTWQLFCGAIPSHVTPDIEQELDSLESKPTDSDDPEPELQLELLLEEQALVATKAKETQIRTMRAIISVHQPSRRTHAKVLS